MQRNSPLLILVLSLVVFLTLGIVLLSFGEHSDADTAEQDLTQWQPYLHYLKEFYQRRRVNIYFKNDQSIFYGAQTSFVNVGRGNLTFARRDLVTGGRIPLTVARVYDSAGRGSSGLGPGWHISATERIEVQGERARLYSETGAEIDFVLVGGEFQLARQFPSDYRSLVITPSGTLQVAMRTGFIREYSLMGNSYRLRRVSDNHGNEVRLAYSGNALSRMENGAHFVEFSRDEQGRVVGVSDDRGWRVSYRYDAKDRLIEVTDIGDNTWRYEYTSQDQLSTALDPLYRQNFKAWYQGDGRMRRLELPSGRIEYQYDDATRSTTVLDRKDLISRYYQNEEGITVRVINPLGEETRIALDANRNATELWENGVLRHQMDYDSEHRIIFRRSFTSSGELTARYDYDPATGKLARISYSGGDSQSFEYDARGNLRSWFDTRSGRRNYEWSSSGDLIKVSRAETGQVLSLAYGVDGLLSEAVGPEHGPRSFRYETRVQPSGITFADEEVARLEYDQLGFRRALEIRDGWSAEYSFDPAGNLVASNVTKSDGTRTGQTLELDDSYQLTRRVFLDGTEARYKYDSNGNLLETVYGSAITRFEYDALNRLTAIVTPEGERLEYRYAPGEPSLIAQSDVETGWLPGERRDSGQTFAPLRQVFANRSYAVPLGTVRFSETLGRFQLSGETDGEIVTPEMAVEAPLRKVRLWGQEAPSHERRQHFLAASNLFFQPAEYATVNCCPLCEIRSGCSDPCSEPEPPPPFPAVNFMGPNKVPLRAAGSTGPNSIELTAEGTPEGGTYKWSTTSTRITLSNETMPKVTVTSVSESGSRGDVPITVEYKVNNTTAKTTGLLTVVKPASLELVPGSDTTNPTGHICDPNAPSNLCDKSRFMGGGVYNSYRRDLRYRVMDHLSPPEWISGFPLALQESFSAPTGQCASDAVAIGMPASGDTVTDCFFFCSEACRLGGSCSVSATQTIKANGFDVASKNVNWQCSGVSIQ